MLTLTNTTVSGNTTGDSDSTTQGGYGGGIFSGISNHLTLINCTVSSNQAGSGGLGSGIRNEGTADLEDTIVANNTVTGGGSGPDLSGSFNSQDYNLIKDISDASFAGTTTHNITGVDPLLGPLAANGGPTLSHALLVGSPAIDAGNSVLTTDQRGQPRPVDDQTVENAVGGNASDIGAYEAHTLEVNSTADADDGLCRALGTGNGCTLREAINAANAEAGAEWITFAPALTSGGPAIVTLSSALSDLSSDMTVSGPGATLLNVQRSNAGGTPNFRIFTIQSGITLNISGLTISGGNPTIGENGGAISNSGTLSLTNTAISGNTVIFGTAGGGIYNSGTRVSALRRHCLRAGQGKHLRL